MNATKTLVIIAAALLISGCTGSRTDYYDIQPAPLQPAPTGNVQSGQLAPIDGTIQNNGQINGQNVDPNINTTITPEQNTQVATLEPAATNQAPAGNGSKITKTAALGAWNASASGSSCKLILSLTQNSDKSYRAAPLRCPNALANVKAWNVEGNQLVLKNSNGEALVSLNKTGAERYQGGIVTLSR